MNLYKVAVVMEAIMVVMSITSIMIKSVNFMTSTCTIGSADKVIKGFNSPWYIHISDEGIVYLTECSEQKLHKLDSQGNILKSINFDGTPVEIYATSTQVFGS